VKYIVSVDDTDMPDTIGTGQLVQNLCEKIENRQWGKCSSISRHQLLVHDDVPYTSHNSSMCFELNLKNVDIKPFIQFTGKYLEAKSAKGSDPGLCIAKSSGQLMTEEIIAFGLKAKSRILKKSDAYSLAEKTGVYLSEHGGTGMGVIGAVAGIGLRLSGNDGRYRGWYHFGRSGDVVTTQFLNSHTFVDNVMTKNGSILNANENVMIGSEKTKTIRVKSRQVILAYANEKNCSDSSVKYRTITKKEAKAY
jgi:hypothetical protein